MRLADSFDRESAREVEFVGRPKPTGHEIAQARTMSIVRMRRMKYTFAAIGQFHGVTRQRAKQLFDAAPAYIRRRVGDVLDPIEGCDAALGR